MTVIPPKSHLKGLSIQFNLSEVILRIWMYNFIFDSIIINYRNGHQPISMNLTNRKLEILIESSNYIKTFYQSLKSLISNSNCILEFFHIDFSNSMDIQEILKNRKRPKKIQVNYIHLTNLNDVKDAVTVLQYFDSDRITVEFKGRKVELKEIFEVELWNGKNWKIVMSNVTSELLLGIRKNFSTNSHPHELTIQYQNIDLSLMDTLFGTTRTQNLDQKTLKTFLKFSDFSIVFKVVKEPSKTLKVLENSLIMENILSYFGCFEIQRLRKVSTSIRHCIDTIKTDSKIRKISIKMDELTGLKLEIFVKNQEFSVFYGDTENGCFVNRRSLSDDFSSRVIKDLEILMKSQKSEIEELTLSFPYYFYVKDVKSVDYGMLEERTDRFLEGLKNCLQSLLLPLQVKKLKMEVFNQHQIIKILSFLNPATIKTIEIGLPNGINRELKFLEINEICGLEQWMKAGELVISDRTTVATRVSEMKLFHFLKVSMAVERITVEDMVSLKENLLSSPNFEKFKFSSKSFDSNIEPLGPPYSKTRNIITWYFQYPSPNQALCIIYNISRSVIFTRIDISAVPNDAFFIG